MKLAKRGYKGPEAPKWSLVHGADGHGARWQGLVFFLKNHQRYIFVGFGSSKKDVEHLNYLYLLGVRIR
jgi:hypothetical protein